MTFESLELRQLMAADVGPFALELPSPEQMAHYRSIDVNDDGTMSPLDVLNVIAHINQRATAEEAASSSTALEASQRSTAEGSSPSPNVMETPQRSPFDVNGDDQVSSLDVLTAINDLNTNGSRELPRYVATPTPLANGRLLIEGTEDADYVVITSRDEEISVESYTADSFQRQTFRRADIVDILFTGFDGDDVFDNQTDIPAFAFGGLGDDLLSGGSSNDSLSGDAGDDVLDGGSGNDALEGGSGDDTLRGGEGDDTYIFAGGNLGSDVVTGEDQADYKHPQAKNSHDMLDFSDFAGPINIDLTPNGTQQVVNEEHLSLSFESDPLIRQIGVALSHPPYVELRDQAYPEFSSVIEDVIGTPFDDVIYGNGRPNLLDGRMGDDRIEGHGDEDVLLGGPGHDSILGHGGKVDILVGGPGNDTLDGGDNMDVLVGGTGNDMLLGGSGEDRYVFAGTDLGSDTILGEEQVDLYNREQKDRPDTLDFSQFGGPVNIDLSKNYSTQVVNPEHLTLTLTSPPYWARTVPPIVHPSLSTAIENVIGSRYDDTISGNMRPNVIDGADGNDELISGAGKDVLIGGRGDDVLNGGSNSDRYVFIGDDLGSDTITGESPVDVFNSGQEDYQDTLDFSQFDGSIEIDLDLNLIRQEVNPDDLYLTLQGETGWMYGHVSHKWIPLPIKSTAIENVIGTGRSDKIKGNDRPNVIIGGNGSDELFGERGDDALFGGSGSNDLYGGSGEDVLCDGDYDDPELKAAYGSRLDDVLGEMERFINRFGSEYRSLEYDHQRAAVREEFFKNLGQAAKVYGLHGSVADYWEDGEAALEKGKQGVVGAFMQVFPDLPDLGKYQDEILNQIEPVKQEITTSISNVFPSTYISDHTVKQMLGSVSPKKIPVIDNFIDGLEPVSQLFDTRWSTEGFGELNLDMIRLGQLGSIPMPDFAKVTNFVNKSIVGAIQHEFHNLESEGFLDGLIETLEHNPVADVLRGACDHMFGGKSAPDWVSEKIFGNGDPPERPAKTDTNDLWWKATPVSAAGVPTSQFFHSAADVDWLSFELRDRSKVEITPGGNAQALNFNYTVYNANGSPVVCDSSASMTQSPNACNFTGANELDPGTYYVQIVQTGPNDSSSYSMTVLDADFDIELVFGQGVDARMQRLAREAADRWEGLILQDLGYELDANGQPVDDLRIDVKLGNCTGGYACAGFDEARPAEGLPWRGRIMLDGVVSNNNDNVVRSALEHEICHVLGFHPELPKFKSYDKTVDGSRVFNGVNAVEQYRREFQKPQSTVIVGVPLDPDGWHWKRSEFHYYHKDAYGKEFSTDELMTSDEGPGARSLSRITLGILDDLGYVVNYDGADAYTTPDELKKQI